MTTKPNKYNDYLITIPVSFIAAELIVGFGQKENYYELLFVPEYYPALIGSTLIAFGIIFWINRWSRYLDKIRPWEEKPKARLGMQLIYGIFLAMLLAVLLAAAYFAFYDIHLKATVYFKYYFLPVLVFVLLINLYYNSEALNLLRKEVEEKPAKKRSPEEIEQLRQYAVQSDMAMVKVGNGMAVAYNSKGTDFIWDVNIRDSVGILPKESFYKIRRNCLVRHDIIREVIHDKDAGRVRLSLNKQFKGVYELPKEETVAFLLWYKTQRSLLPLGNSGEGPEQP